MSIPDFNKSFRDAVFPGSKEPATTFNFVVSVGTRALGDFRSQGLIELGRSRVVIKDPAGLAEIAHSE